MSKREKKISIENLPQPQQELSPEQAEEAKGGIIAILIGLHQEPADVQDGTSNTLLRK